MDGNVFFCEVSYNDTDRTVTLVEGHFWKFDGKSTAYKGLGERWKEKTSDWFGSNSDAGPEIRNFSYLLTEFGYNPFSYPQPHDNSGAENQYISNKDLIIILDYKASVIEGGEYLGPIATYAKDYGKGRSVVFGFFTDKVQSNQTFLRFFDIVFDEYAIKRSKSPLPGTAIPAIGPMLEARPTPFPMVQPGDPKQTLEDKVRKYMLEKRSKNKG